MIEQSVNGRLQSLLDIAPEGFGWHDGEKARWAMQQINATDDDELRDLVLTMGCRSAISNRHSRDRARLKRKVRSMTKGRPSPIRQMAIQQLHFPVVVPGHESRDVVFANHEFVVWAVEDAERNLRGLEENIEILRHIARVTEPFPGLPIHQLLRSGQITVDDLFPGSQQERRAA